MKTGRIERYDDTVGYGFIIDDEGNKFYLHHDEIRTCDPGTLASGDHVRFDVQDGSPHPRAVSVQITQKADGSPVPEWTDDDLLRAVLGGRRGRRHD